MKTKLFLTTLLLLLTSKLCAYDFELNGINYNITDYERLTVEVARCNSQVSGEVSIPESVTFEGKIYSVTGIGFIAFEMCQSITSVIIPNSVTYLRQQAFNGCTQLNSITLPNSIFSIEDYTFSSSGLTSIEIPNSVTSIGRSAFQNCLKLKSVVLPNSIISIGDGAFVNCGLTSIKFPSSLTSIGQGAFNGCSLTSIEIPSSVTSIREGTFSNNKITSFKVDTENPVFHDESNCIMKGKEVIAGCSSSSIPEGAESIASRAFTGCDFTTINVPNSVTSIGKEAFSYCRNMTSIALPSTVRSIEKGAFLGCISLTSFTIPNSVTSIEDNLFEYCSSLTSIEIPNNVTSIGERAFEGCSSLASIEIPSGVTKIERSTFSGCHNMKTITIPNSIISIGKEAFYSCSSLTSIEIPNGLIEIETGSFAGCSGLTSIEIPSGVTKIYDNAFEGCTGLKTVICNSSMPPSTKTGGGIFKNVAIENAELIIKKSSLSKYVDTAPWSSFGSFRKIDSEEEEEVLTESYISGDFNYDGQITAADITHLVDVALGKANPTYFISHGVLKIVHLAEEEKISLWKNDGSMGMINWGGDYRFSNEFSSTGEECYAMPMDDWESMMNGEFKVVIEGENPRIRVTTGWWTFTWSDDDIIPDNKLLVDNGDGTWTLTVNLIGSEVYDIMDQQHLLFTGEGYQVNEIYISQKWINEK